MLSNSDILRMILGFKIKYLRQQKSLSYHELSRITGLSKSYLNDIEKGKKFPKPEKIQALAEAFGLDYNDLVSTSASKKLQPVIDLLSSDFFKLFPMDEFGIDAEKIVDVLSNAPDKVNAFISTVIKIARSYQIESEQFYRIALRSYQDMHDNYFPLLEESANTFISRYLGKYKKSIPTAALEKILMDEYGITVDRQTLKQKESLHSFRSYYNHDKKILFLNDKLSSAQENFIITKEIGFQFLSLTERPFETRLNKEASFEKLLSNFKASYFSAAVLIPEQKVIKDLKKIALESKWKPNFIIQLIKKYNITPEMYLQRLTNILPEHFGIANLFFLKMETAEGLRSYTMTKELHLSQLHSPYKNELNEHFCHRWVSINSLKKVRTSSYKDSDTPYVIEVQKSKYWETDNEYFCLSIAQAKAYEKATPNSITLGLMVTPELRATFNFLKDDQIPQKVVNTTCERCSMPDCDNRVAPPTIIENRNLQLRQAEELNKL